MVSRNECNKFARMLGVSSLDVLTKIGKNGMRIDNKGLGAFFQQVQSRYLAENKECIAKAPKGASKEFLEALVNECNDELESNVAYARVAEDFLQENGVECVVNAKCADSYQILGLSGGDRKVINKQYKKLTREYHPDTCKDYADICSNKQTKINEARKFLLDEKNYCTEISNLEDFFAAAVSSTPNQESVVEVVKVEEQQSQSSLFGVVKVFFDYLGFDVPAI